MDKEEFQAWKASPATQWVLARLRNRALAVEERLCRELYQSTGLSTQEWASLQSRAGFDRGVATGLNFVVELEHEEVDEQERD